MQIGHSAKYLDDLIPRKLQEGDVGSIASHEIAIQDPQDAFMGDDEQIVLLSLQLENDWFKTNSEVMI